MQAGEGDGSAHPQASAQARPALLHHGIGLVDLGQDLSRPQIVGLSGLGGRQPPGRTQQQAAAKVRLKLGNQSGNRGLPHPQSAGHRRKRAGLHRQHEHLHHPQAIHLWLLCPVALFVAQGSTGPALSHPRSGRRHKKTASRAVLPWKKGVGMKYQPGTIEQRDSKTRLQELDCPKATPVPLPEWRRCGRNSGDRTA